MNNEITYDDFAKLDLRVGEVKSVEKIEGSSKLLKCIILIGDSERVVIGGVGKSYTPEDLIGKQVVVLTNLEPKALMGETSHGMLLASCDENGLPVLLTVEKLVPHGSVIK